MKVGDKVKVIGGKLIGKIIDIDINPSTDYCYLVNSWWYKKEELELITGQSTPKRYATDSIDVIDFVKLYNLNFNLGNVVKYTCRDKGTDIEDYKKAIDYLQREIKHLESLE